MNPQYQDLYRRDQQRLAAWPPKFRGEGPFLPTGRRKPARFRSTLFAVATVGLLSAAALQWRIGAADVPPRHAVPAKGGQAATPPSTSESVGMAKP